MFAFHVSALSMTLRTENILEMSQTDPITSFHSFRQIGYSSRQNTWKSADPMAKVIKTNKKIREIF
jgi:hypothetical protein